MIWKVKLFLLRKLARPRPPMDLCDSWLEWMFGIVSPSKYANALMGNIRSSETERYHDKMLKHLKKIKSLIIRQIEWKIDKRIANRNECRFYYHYKRKEMRQSNDSIR